VEKLVGNSPTSEDYIPNYPMSLPIYELIVVVFLIPLVFIRNIKNLAPLSIVANIGIMGGLALVLYYILVYKELRSVSRLPLIKDWQEIPLYFGTAIYAFEGIGVVSY